MAFWLLPVMALKNLINYVSNTFIGIPAESNRLAFCNRINARDISRPLRVPFAGPQKQSNDNRLMFTLRHFRSLRSKRFQSSRRSRRTRAETLATQADTSEVKLAKIKNLRSLWFSPFSVFPPLTITLVSKWTDHVYYQA